MDLSSGPELRKYPNLDTSLRQALLNDKIHDGYKIFILDSQLELSNFISNSNQLIGYTNCCFAVAVVSPLDAPFGIYRSQVRRIYFEHGYKEVTDIRHNISNDIDIPFFIRESLIVVCRDIDVSNAITSIDDVCIADRVIHLLNVQEKKNDESKNYFVNSSQVRFSGKALIKLTLRHLYRIYSSNTLIFRPIWVLVPQPLKTIMRKLISKSFSQ